MEKRLALTFILSLQPIFAWLIWFSMTKLFDWLVLEENVKNIAVIATSIVLYLIFCFMFARGFLGSDEARKLGF